MSSEAVVSNLSLLAAPVSYDGGISDTIGGAMPGKTPTSVDGEPLLINAQPTYAGRAR